MRAVHPVSCYLAEDALAVGDDDEADVLECLTRPIERFGDPWQAPSSLRTNLILGSDNSQSHCLDARIVLIVGNVEAKFVAHDKHGRILR